MENTVMSENLLSQDVVLLFSPYSPVGTIFFCENGIFSAVLLWIILLGLTRLKWKKMILELWATEEKKNKIRTIVEDSAS